MSTWKRLALVAGFAGAGFAIVLCLLIGALAWYTNRPKHSIISRAPAKALPAQVLSFVDGTGRSVASLDFIPGWHNLAVFDADGKPFANFFDVETDGYRELWLYSLTGHDSLGSATFGSDPSFTISRQDGTSKFILSKSTPKDPASATGWIKRIGRETSRWAFRRVVPETPLWTLDKIIPSHDLTLLDKDGTAFAALGLGRGGEPTVALFDKRGTIQLVWTYSYDGRWPELHLFDDKDIRVSIETRPPTSVRLIISEPDGDYVLDPRSYDEVPESNAAESGAIPWLSHKILPVRLPIKLLDVRNNVLWRTP